MSKKNFIVTIAFDQHQDYLVKCVTYIKSPQAEVQERIDTELQFRSNMTNSIIAAGIAANLLQIERWGGHNRWQNLQQLVERVESYLNGSVACFPLEDFMKKKN